MKLNDIDEVWNSAKPLFKWRIGLLPSKNFATVATWLNDFSPLLIIKLNVGRKQVKVVNFLVESL